MALKKELSRFFSEDGRLVLILSEYDGKYIIDAFFDEKDAARVEKPNLIQAEHIAEDIVLRYDAGEVDGH